MRDLFADLASPTGSDPVAKARSHAKRHLPKRFYEHADIEPDDGGWRLVLDGRPVRTPERRLLRTPREAVARAVAAEWSAQADEVDPAVMPVTRLVHTAIDGVANDPAGVADAIAAYAGSDLLFYRADAPERLVERQRLVWDPILREAEAHFGIRFVLAAGVMPVDQDPRLVPTVRAALPDDPFALTALHVLTTISGSALIALAVHLGWLDGPAAWAAANLDEDWNTELWGVDSEASRRAAFRRAELDAALLLLGR